MDTLTRDFTSYNCSSGTLRRPESNKQNNLNNAVSKNCNVKDDNHGSNPDVWKRMSNVRNDDEAVTNCLLTDIPFVISSSRETISSEDGTEKCDSYDLVASSNCNSQQSLSSSDFTSSQTSDKRGFYSFINSKDSFESNSQEPRDDSRYFEGDDKSPPGTPIRTKRPLRRKQKITLSPSTERPNSEQLKRPNTSDPFGVRDDFGKSASLSSL